MGWLFGALVLFFKISNLSYSANVKTAIQPAKVDVSRFFVCVIVQNSVRYCKKMGRKMAVKWAKVVKRSYKICVQNGHKSGGHPIEGCPPLSYLPPPLPSLWVPK